MTHGSQGHPTLSSLTLALGFYSSRAGVDPQPM